ncbi:MAG TPA: choice-of-anchor D domain-containing protein [Solirubrobacteraceae bacterium]|nr:choice-of-anchor D domain-containing protein [Solirubrobacteraceae bacterium]
MAIAALIAVRAPAAWADGAPDLYFSEHQIGSIGRAGINGSNPDYGFASGNLPAGMAVDQTRVYWFDFGTGGSQISSVSRDGAGFTTVVTGMNLNDFGEASIAIAGGQIFWTEPVENAIGEANLDGSGVNHDFITGAADPTGIAVSDGHIYWTNTVSGTIGEANLDGTDVNQDFITGLTSPQSLAATDSHLYFIDIPPSPSPETFGEANLDGSGVDQSFLTGVSGLALAVDSHHLYWSQPTVHGAVGEANLDGTDVNANLVPPDPDDPFAAHLGLAVSQPLVQVSPASPPAFGSRAVGTLSSPQVITVSNAGENELDVHGLTLSGVDPGDFLVTSNGCLGPVAVGGSCQLTVAFAPQATGARSATLDIASTDYANSPTQIPLTGTGASPSVLIGSSSTCSSSGILTVTTTCTSAYAYSGAPAGPTGGTVVCTTSRLRKTTTCTVTYSYAKRSAAAAGHARARATAVIHGRRVVVGRGRIRGHRVKLHLKRLKRGRYRLTLWRLVRHARPIVIGHRTLVVR